MENLAKHNNRSPLFVDKADMAQVAGLLDGLTPNKKGVEWMRPPTLYQQCNGIRPPTVLACHNAQVAAKRFPIWELVAGWSNHVLVPLPDVKAAGHVGLLMLEATKEFGDVAEKIRAAFDPQSAGGVRCTKEEWKAVKREALQAIAKLHEVMAAQP